MAQGIGGFVKQNAAIGGALGVGLGAVEIAGSENKLKGIASVLAQILTFKAGIAAMFVGTFKAASNAIQGVIRDTGSLDAALQRAGKSAEDLGKAYAKAKENMKASAGASWVESEITNTKNMKRAVEALTPAVAEASSTWAKFTGGFSGLKSEMIKTAAESGYLGKAITGTASALAYLAVGVSVISKGVLASWLVRAGIAAGESSAKMTGWIGVLARMGSMALRLTGIGIVVGVIVQAASAWYNYYQRIVETANATNRINREAAATAQAMSLQINSIKTLEDHHAALTQALENSAAAHKKWLETMALPADQQWQKDAAMQAKRMAELQVRQAATRVPASEVAGAGNARNAVNSEIAAKQTARQLELENAPSESRPNILRRHAIEDAGEAAAGEAGLRGRDATTANINDIEVKKQLAIFDGGERKRQLEGEVARARTKTGAGPKEAARLQEIIDGLRPVDEQAFEDQKTEEMKKSGSAAMRAEGQSREKMKGRYLLQDGAEKDKLDQELAVLQGEQRKGEAQEGSATQKRESSKSLMNQAQREDARLAITEQISAIEEEISQSKEVGYELSVKERDARIAAADVIINSTDAITSAEQKSAARATKARESRAGEIEALAHKSEMRQNQASLDTSTIRGEGYEVEKQKDAIERKRLVAEEAAAVGDEAKMKAKAALNAHDTMRSGKEVAQYESADALNDELRRSHAQARGNSARVTEIDDFEEFRKNFDARKGVMGLDQAKEDAMSMATDAITLRATNDMNSSNAGVASASMARIGGGGGIGPGATSMIDLQKRTNDLLESADWYLKMIKEKRDGIPAN